MRVQSPDDIFFHMGAVPCVLPASNCESNPTNKNGQNPQIEFDGAETTGQRVADNVEARNDGVAPKQYCKALSNNTRPGKGKWLCAMHTGGRCFGYFTIACHTFYQFCHLHLQVQMKRRLHVKGNLGNPFTRHLRNLGPDDWWPDFGFEGPVAMLTFRERFFTEVCK